MKAKIYLDTRGSIMKFVNICSKFEEPVYLQDGENFCVSAKSLLGAIATMDWSEVYVVCDKDIRTSISEFLAD